MTGVVKTLLGVKNNIKSKYAAFTLAEVLITLAIVGVVAALTIPNLVQRYQERQTVTKLNATYAILNEALRLMVVDNGTVDTWGSSAYLRMKKIKEILPEYLKIQKFCTKYDDGCFVAAYGNVFDDTLFKGEADSNLDSLYGTSFLLFNGVAVHFFPRNPMKCTVDTNSYYSSDEKSNSVCGVVRIDVNGSVLPNVYNKDMFRFFVTRDGIVPTGVNKISFENYCLKNTDIEHQGYCSGWVITNKNMDYLHCPDKLIWNKVRSCN